MFILEAAEDFLSCGRVYRKCKMIVWPQSAGTTSAMETGLGLSDVQLESADLWIPGVDGQEYNHKQWLTTLACTLIESGFVQDEILLILSPMCKTKVTIGSIRLFI